MREPIFSIYMYFFIIIILFCCGTTTGFMEHWPWPLSPVVTSRHNCRRCQWYAQPSESYVFLSLSLTLSLSLCLSLFLLKHNILMYKKDTFDILVIPWFGQPTLLAHPSIRPYSCVSEYMIIIFHHSLVYYIIYRGRETRQVLKETRDKIQKNK